LSNGHLFVLSPDDPYENVLFWDPLTNGDEYLIPIPPDLTFSHTISPDGKLLAISDLVNCDVKFYSINSGINLGNLTDCQGDISRMGFSPDNLILAVAMNGGDIKFFDFNTKTEVGTVLHNSGIRDLIFSQDGRYFVTSSEDGTIRVWAVAP
jgi:WD40 repeat protein